jgi:hypothetical protein
MKNIAGFFLACLLTITGRAEPLDFTGLKNDREANLATIKCMEGMGLDITAKADESFVINHGGYKIMISPNIGKIGGDFMIAYVNFNGIGKSNVKSTDLSSLVARINGTFNYVTVFIDSDGDIVFRYVLLFDKKLEPKLVLKWLAKIENQSDGISRDFGKELSQFLK